VDSGKVNDEWFKAAEAKSDWLEEAEADVIASALELVERACLGTLLPHDAAVYPCRIPRPTAVCANA
jgi:hypothetical protein